MSEEVRGEIAKVQLGCFVLYTFDQKPLEMLVCQYFRGSINIMCSSEFQENFLIRNGL
jgi:multisite-specific tRNA:(cytosine-C5)-methyltransferase/tRNA (cytosine34-C5)-methyltransferase